MSLSYSEIWPHSRISYLTAGTLLASGFILRSLLTSKASSGGTDIIPSPLTTLLPRLTSTEQQALPYPIDTFPGARDVQSPYGTFRVYEFGPEDGRKVLLVHGISTPCIALGGLAEALAGKGCRVMLMDLPGRGYSETPAPENVKQDVKLFVSQILIVLASSKLAWTGSQGFALIGYSLGGGIAAAFTSYFPDMISSLILIAPSGLIRDHLISWKSRIIYRPDTIFEPLLIRIVRSRLQQPLYTPKKGQPDPDEDAGPKTAVQAEVNIEGNQRVVLSKSHPDVTIEAAVNHQVHYHIGFVKAFMSSIRYGPIQNQHDKWRRIGQHLRLTDGKVLMILGERDPIIKANELQEDASEVLDGRVKFIVMDAGHEVPVAKGPEVADHIWDFWNVKGTNALLIGSHVATYVFRSTPTEEWNMDGTINIDHRGGLKILMAGMAQS